MKKLVLFMFLGLVISCFGNEGEAVKEEVVFSFKPTKQVFESGENITFQFLVVNNSKNDITVVKILDGSDIGRQPQGKISIWGLDGKEIIEKFRRCGNTNPLTKNDFILVKSGAEADLSGFGMTLSGPQSQVPGKYKIKFTYSSMDDEFSKWVGGPMGPEGVAEVKKECFELFKNRVKVSKTFETEIEIIPKK